MGLLLWRLGPSCALVALAAGHGAMVIPKPRNAIDGTLPIWDKGGCQARAEPAVAGVPCYPCNCGHFGALYTDPATKVAGLWSPGCVPGTRESMNGQSCLWFTQGTSIGCPSADNTTQRTRGKSLCASPTARPTLPRYAWTMNRWVAEGSPEDMYSHHPWRAPGSAPVVDSCGLAGGDPNPGVGAAVFAATEFATQGSVGTAALKKGPPAASWSRGESVEVSWGIRANHGGGYQYRLCPANATRLDEECFRKTPLAFTGPSQIRYTNGELGKPFNRTEVNKGTIPVGSTWAMNPIPRINFDESDDDSVGPHPPWSYASCPNGQPNATAATQTIATCKQFQSPACDESDPTTHDPSTAWHAVPGGDGSSGVEGKCSGDFISGSIVDHVVIPKSLAPGDYVLGWRWDVRGSDHDHHHHANPRPLTLPCSAALLCSALSTCCIPLSPLAAMPPHPRFVPHLARICLSVSLSSCC
jgi:hypothetical protein